MKSGVTIDTHITGARSADLHKKTVISLKASGGRLKNMLFGFDEVIYWSAVSDYALLFIVLNVYASVLLCNQADSCATRYGRFKRNVKQLARFFSFGVLCMKSWLNSVKLFAF